MRIALFGRTHWLISVGRRLLSDGHSIVFVATAKAAPEYSAKESDFEDLAGEAGAVFFLSPDINSEDCRQAIERSGAEVGISVNWPNLVRRQTCDALPYSVLNGHAGDLPRYRGNACPNWAIINGEPHIGLCVHAMEPDAVDAGPVYVRRRLPVDEATYILDVYRWINTQLPDMFSEAIERLQDQEFVPEDQAHGGVVPLRCHPRRPEDSLVDWSASSDSIARLVRASSRPLAGAYTFLDGRKRVVIWRARPARLDDEILAVNGQILGRSAAGGVLVACGNGVLEIEDAEISGEGGLPAANRHRLTHEKADGK